MKNAGKTTQLNLANEPKEVYIGKEKLLLFFDPERKVILVEGDFLILPDKRVIYIKSITRTKERPVVNYRVNGEFRRNPYPKKTISEIAAHFNNASIVEAVK